MEELTPINDRVLVELIENIIATPDKQYATRTTGVVIAVSNGFQHDLKGKQIYFETFRDPINIGNKQYVFVKKDEIDGYTETS
jgi:co-chaperonin GroES (HSP10)